MFGNGVPRLRNKDYQNQKQLLPEPETIVTKTWNESYQNQGRELPENEKIDSIKNILK